MSNDPPDLVEPDDHRIRVQRHMARRLREARAGVDMTQAELAKRLGMTQAAVSLWESGMRTVGVADLDLIARVFGKPLAYFLDFDAEGEPDPERALTDEEAEAERRAMVASLYSVPQDASEVAQDRREQAEGEGEADRCRIFGHKWAPWRAVTGPYCLRCGAEAVATERGTDDRS